ncbi:hypothetical protein KKH81_01210 [Patescibacteria group bacterium]|nr:hypothetical protein [Patescibacteria group bacterium]
MRHFDIKEDAMRVIALVFATLCLTVFGGSIAAAKEVSNQEVAATVDLVLKENGLTQEAATRMLPGAEYTIFGHKETVRKDFYVWNGVKKYLVSAPPKPVEVVRTEVPKRSDPKPGPKEEVLGTGKSYLDDLAAAQEVARNNEERVGTVLLIIVAVLLICLVAGLLEFFHHRRRNKLFARAEATSIPDDEPDEPSEPAKPKHGPGSYDMSTPKVHAVPEEQADLAAETKTPESIHEVVV